MCSMFSQSWPRYDNPREKTACCQKSADLCDKLVRLPKGLSLQLHFVHERSSDPNAIPLIFSHGWPGSFIEAFKIIKKLTNPGMRLHAVGPLHSQPVACPDEGHKMWCWLCLTEQAVHFRPSARQSKKLRPQVKGSLAAHWSTCSQPHSYITGAQPHHSMTIWH